MRAFLHSIAKKPRFRFGALLWIAGRASSRFASPALAAGGEAAGGGGGGGGSGGVVAGGASGGAGAPAHRMNQSDLTTCAPGMVWDTKRRKCLTRRSGVLSGPRSHRIRLCARQGRPVPGSDRRARPPDNPNTPRALNYRGYATRKLGRTDEGIGYYLKSVALDPNYPQVREYLGEAYVIRGQVRPRQSSNCRRSRSFAVRTASITRIWPTR